MSNAQICPLCGKENNCAMSLAKEQAASCWCMDVRLSEEEREEIKQRGLDPFCLCIDCVTRLRQESR